MKKKDFEQGTDIRGDEAVFIESRHIINVWDLDDTAKKFVELNFKGIFFFRVIENGVQKSRHGWIESEKSKIIK